MNITAVLFMLAGLFFFFTGTVGLLRFPDVYTRMHATGKCDTLGAQLMLAGIAIANGWNLVSVKLILIFAFMILANPTATHAMIRAATNSGEPLWKRESKQ
ncbi:MAG: monovalent cation/H(+) antiporter subunit G [Candidatus Binatia bacterium]